MERKIVKGPVVIDYEMLAVPDAKRAIFLFHGFGESGPIILKRLRDVLPQNQTIIAANGVYPLPEKKNDEWIIRYAWYFYNRVNGQYFIGQEIAAEVFENLVHDLKLSDTPLTLIGYSQGGYLVPFLAQRLPNCDHVIGINCEFKVDMLTGPFHFRLDAINGKEDLLVDPHNAQRSHEKLLKKGAMGEFQMVNNSGHRLDLELKNALKNRLEC